MICPIEIAPRGGTPRVSASLDVSRRFPVSVQVCIITLSTFVRLANSRISGNGRKYILDLFLN